MRRLGNKYFRAAACFVFTCRQRINRAIRYFMQTIAMNRPRSAMMGVLVVFFGGASMTGACGDREASRDTFVTYTLTPRQTQCSRGIMVERQHYFGRLVFDRDAIVRAALRAYVELRLAKLDPLNRVRFTSAWAAEWEGDVERGAFYNDDGCGDYEIVAWNEAGIVGLAYELGCGPIEQLDLSIDAVTGGPDDVRGAVPELPDELESAFVMAGIISACQRSATRYIRHHLRTRTIDLRGVRQHPRVRTSCCEGVRHHLRIRTIGCQGIVHCRCSRKYRHTSSSM